MRKFILYFAFAVTAVSGNSEASSLFGIGKMLTSYSSANGANDTFKKAPSDTRVENAFSPDAGAEALVLKTINSAEVSILLAGYSFTSPNVVASLIAAKKRGVDVRVVVDEKSNLHEGKNIKGKIALDTVVNAGIPTRTISVYAIFHDKTIVVDAKHVLTGSFNFSKAAATSNSENVLVLWNYPTTAASYKHHWESRWNQGRDYKSSY